MTDPSIFHPNSFIHMNFKRIVIWIFSKYAQVIIRQIYLKNPYQRQHSKSWYTKLGCVSSKIFLQILKNLCQDEGEYTYWGKYFILEEILYVVLFFLTRFLSYRVFPSKVLIRQLYISKII